MRVFTTIALLLAVSKLNVGRIIPVREPTRADTRAQIVFNSVAYGQTASNNSATLGHVSSRDGTPYPNEQAPTRRDDPYGRVPSNSDARYGQTPSNNGNSYSRAPLNSASNGYVLLNRDERQDQAAQRADPSNEPIFSNIKREDPFVEAIVHPWADARYGQSLSINGAPSNQVPSNKLINGATQSQSNPRNGAPFGQSIVSPSARSIQGPTANDAHLGQTTSNDARPHTNTRTSLNSTAPNRTAPSNNVAPHSQPPSNTSPRQTQSTPHAGAPHDHNTKRGSVPYSQITPRPVTEIPFHWCDESDELTVHDLEGSGSDEVPDSMKGLVTDEWRENHPDEQISDDDPMDSYELETKTIVEVLY